MLPLFTQIIKTECIYNSNQNAKLKGLDEERPSRLIKRGSEAQALKVRVENVSHE
jgi:hypothetical protein